MSGCGIVGFAGGNGGCHFSSFFYKNLCWTRDLSDLSPAIYRPEKLEYNGEKVLLGCFRDEPPFVGTVL